MIQSKADLKEYLIADRIANKYSNYYKYPMLCKIMGGYNYLYLWYLRHYEYVLNVKKSIIWKYIRTILEWKLRKWSCFTGITIPPNTFGKGLYIPHWGSIVVNGSARFGDNCVVQGGVNISEAVRGGNHIYIGAGAKILSNVELGDDVIVAANAVVNKSFTEYNIVIGGIPAQKLSEKGFRSRKKI